MSKAPAQIIEREVNNKADYLQKIENISLLMKPLKKIMPEIAL